MAARYPGLPPDGSLRRLSSPSPTPRVEWPPRRPRPGPPIDRTRRLALGAALLHALVAGYHMSRGVSIRHDFGPSTWDFFWQNLPTEDLRDRALQSLWYLHAQPPLWNALNAPLVKLFGGAHPEALQAVHVLLGCAIAALAALIAARLARSEAAGVAAGALVALDPALVLYEAYALYELLCAFLILFALWAAARAGPEGRSGPLLLAVGATAALVLTRSLYHLAVVVPAVVGAAALAGRRRQVLVAATAIALLPTGWYAKNLVQHGFFGGSSWYGMGIWRVALFRYRGAELQPLLEAGRLDRVVLVPPFARPSRYRALGYDRTSEIPSLARDDFHNVNLPAISDAYGRSANRLIRYRPLHFLANVAIGYGNFSAPSTEYDHLAPDRERMGVHVTVYRTLTLLPLVRALDRRLPIGTLGSVFALLIPLALAAHGWLLARRWRRGDPVERILREEAPLIAAGALIAYTALVGSALELGENVRFKFMIEPLLLTHWTVVSVRIWRGRVRSSADGTLASTAQPFEL